MKVIDNRHKEELVRVETCTYGTVVEHNGEFFQLVDHDALSLNTDMKGKVMLCRLLDGLLRPVMFGNMVQRIKGHFKAEK